MELINVVKQNTHGGSLRYICGRKNVHKINNNVEKLFLEEKLKNLDNPESCYQFKKDCELSKLKLRENYMDTNHKVKNLRLCCNFKKYNNFKLL